MTSYLYNKLPVLLGGEKMSGGDTREVKIETAQSVSPNNYADDMRKWREASVKHSAKEQK